MPIDAGPDQAARMSSGSSSRVTPDEYPSFVNNGLFAILREHTVCNCPAVVTPDTHHDAVLRLTQCIKVREDQVLFDLHFRSTLEVKGHSSYCRWQQLRLNMPK